MKVHFIAIGGSAMHNLAIALHNKGFEVSGSDDEIFEPSRSRLDKLGLLPSKNGWFPEKITSDLDFVILGMHARADNPELLKARELGLKLVSYPEFIYEQSKNKTRVVIAGSHGKTTITAMILHALQYNNIECDFMVGAQLEGFDTMVKLTDHNEFILLEGDEYLSSPIDLKPKFLHYRPNIALLSGIAWDHINVFKTYEEYKHQFALLLNHIEPGGVIVYNEADPEIIDVVENTANEIKRFSYNTPLYQMENGKTILQTPEGDIPLAIFGRHNMNNLEGARWICNQMGCTDEQFYEAIASFTGASRRLEILESQNDLFVYRDFAHAPSKVKATVQAVREKHPDQQLIAALELHTFSSLNPNFIGGYKDTLSLADLALVYYSPEVVKHKKLPDLSPEEVKLAFGNPANLKVVTSSQELLAAMNAAMTGNKKKALLLMSSGNFDGITWKESLKSWR